MLLTMFSIHASLEQFTIECRKTKPTVINLANDKSHGLQGNSQNSK